MVDDSNYGLERINALLKKTANILREEGYLARIIPDPRIKNNYEVWRSVNKK